MQSNGSSESHQNNNLKVLTAFAEFLGRDVTFLDIKESHPTIRFLDSKLKNVNDDPERKSIITWNDYLSRIKYFFRWLHNNKEKDAFAYQSEWITPHFARIREKKTKRLSPYLEAELWEKEEILSIPRFITSINKVIADIHKGEKDGRTSYWLQQKHYEQCRDNWDEIGQGF
jgi:hypothetical protein